MNSCLQVSNGVPDTSTYLFMACSASLLSRVKIPAIYHHSNIRTNRKHKPQWLSNKHLSLTSCIGLRWAQQDLLKFLWLTVGQLNADGDCVLSHVYTISALLLMAFLQQAGPTLFLGENRGARERKRKHTGPLKTAQAENWHPQPPHYICQCKYRLSLFDGRSKKKN